jgi:hypothetical protein
MRVARSVYYVVTGKAEVGDAVDRFYKRGIL